MWSVIGHDDNVRLLGHALSLGRLAHAYLLVGPAHVGKMTLAMDLAAAVNCESGDPPCGECPQCRGVMAGRHADILVLAVEETAGKRSIGIDAVRDATRQAHLKPYQGHRRVFIVDGAEALSDEASNAMLKVLEEPPPQLLMLLLAPEAEPLIPTLRSRCQQLSLRPLSEDRVAGALAERWGAPTQDARRLARLSRGRIGWAVTAWRDPTVLETRARRLERIVAVVEGGVRERFAYAAELAGLVPQERTAVREVLDLWAGWWHDLLVVREGAPEAVLDGGQSEESGRSDWGFDRGELAQAVREVLLAQDMLELNANPRLVLEALMLALPTPVARDRPHARPSTGSE
jgi:DNA polymerase-3 subunit delta'